MAVLDGCKPLDESLDKFSKKYDLSPQDKSFAHALCGFVLRHHGALQNHINDYVQKSPGFQVNLILMLGAAQIYFMRSVPHHAAVDTCVTLAKKVKAHHQKGMVNAVLRNMIRSETPDLKPSLPEWLVATWEIDYGKDIAKQIEHASVQEAKIGISNKDGMHKIIPSFRRRPESNPQKILKQVQDDAFFLNESEWVQDYSSAQPVSMMGDISGKYVLDLCAAPGGKTMQLASKGAYVTAVDISEKRLRRLRDNLDRTNLSDHVEVVCADILRWKPERPYDVVLLDAPCSATGTIRRHPDLPYIRTEKDMNALVKLQSQLLNHIKTWGDLIVYCTCSLQKDEGERQIDRFLENHPEYCRAQDDLRLLPSEGDRDGFYTAWLIQNII